MHRQTKRIIQHAIVLGCSVQMAWAAEVPQDAPGGSLLPEMGLAGAAAAPRREMAPASLRVNNRILCTVLGQPISVLDVQKHMEVQFYTHFPQYRGVPQAKWEFFQVQWRGALDELINRALVLADAEERDLDIPEGDVREEMIRRFGVDLAVAMDAMQLDLNETWEMVRLEIKAQKMLGGMVYFPAFSAVTPERVREAYQQMVAKAEEGRGCRYRILTVRSSERDLAQSVIERAYDLLSKRQLSAQETLEDLQRDLPKGVTCQLSEEYQNPLPKISPSYREVLDKLQVGAFSAPVQQQSRSDQAVQRIFLLTGRDEPTIPPFVQVAQKIQEQLTDQQAGQLHETYIGQLRERYGITGQELDRVIPSGFSPFEVR